VVLSVVLSLAGLVVIWITTKPKKGEITKWTKTSKWVLSTATLTVVWVSCWVRPAETREVDEPELGETTKYQEAIIMDLYFGDVPIEKSEVVAYMRTNVYKMLGPDNGVGQENELFKRGILTVNSRVGVKEKSEQRLPGKTVTTGVYGNTYLTKKGKELAQDILYLRDHPEIAKTIARPE
jgi:hypothetical protein